MRAVGEIERTTQNRVVQLFCQQLHYDYLGDWEARADNSNIEEEYLRNFLVRQGYRPVLIDRAIQELNRVAGNQNKSLYDINKEVYSLLRYGVTIQAAAGENPETVWLIDWEDPLNNHFAIAEEVTVSGQHNKRPDVVLYVNGIALGVLELKRSIVSVSEGIRQNLDNQKKIFIQPFFTTMQLIMAGNNTEGLRYGTIETPEKYYLTWKEEDRNDIDPSLSEYPLELGLLHLCGKRRFLEIIHDFVAFDSGVKKLCRHNQYFGVKAAQERIRQRQGGIIWHTQGSGKSLTMVWLAKWIRENIPGSRVLIVTDRVELDEQIEKVFMGVDEKIHRTTSGADLVAKLNATYPWLMCSLIHKFGGKEDGDVDGFIAELTRTLPKDFKAKGDIYVFVDEAHRTQSGELHKAMKSILPDAMLIGFTGTPLLRADKQKTIEVFGPYIHTYKYDEAVRDGVVLDLRYEARDIDQDITSQEKIDQWFEAKTRGLNDVARAQLKKRWGTMQSIYSSQDRLKRIVNDILLDMETRPRLMTGHGNALLVAGSIYQACKFYKLFQDHGFEKCAIITSYKPNAASIRGEETGEGETEKLEQYEIYQQMLGGRDVETFEKEVKKKFVVEPGQMRLLIVVDRLLTGFDAPPATYLYIDKQMRDHGLFQAICRVNRLDGDDKEYGYIIDYKDLFNSLAASVHDYTSAALDGYDQDDVEGLLTDRLEKGRERLEAAREAIKALCEPVEAPRDSTAYIRYFCISGFSYGDTEREKETRRLTLYKLTAALIRAYANLANEMSEAGYSPQEAETIKNEVTYYTLLRDEIKLASGDYIDLKMYEPAMRHLIDSYIRADESRKISAFDDMTLVQMIVEQGIGALNNLPVGITRSPSAVAETVENNLRKVIIEERAVNPIYYERMSALLEALIQRRRAEALKYEEYLQELVELTRQIANPASSSGPRYPESINRPALRSLYDNLGGDENLALALDQAIQNVRQDNWRGNLFKERRVRGAIRSLISDETEADRIFDIVKNQKEY